jgi:multicomponent Na+:H+ antiporter subunit B
MIYPHDSTIVKTLSRLLIPMIQLYSVYILFHAQYSPGGGFVGGVLFGASLILTVLVFGANHSGTFIERVAFRGDGVGLLVFAIIGMLCMAGGEAFLNYAALPLPGLDEPSRRSIGIVATQVGVAMDVAVVAISIFFSLSPQEEYHAPVD